MLHSVTVAGMFAIVPMVLLHRIRSENYVLHDLLIYEPCMLWTPYTCCFNLFGNVFIIKHDKISYSITKYISRSTSYENGALIGTFFAVTMNKLQYFAKTVTTEISSRLL